MAAHLGFRRVGATTAAILCGLIVACEQQSFAPATTPSLSRARVVQVPRTRVIEPGDAGVPVLPGIGAWMSAAGADLINSTFIEASGRTWALESTGTDLVELRGASDGSVDLSTVRRIDVRSVGLRNPQGLTNDPATGRLFVVDGGPRVVVIEPGSDGDYRTPITSEIELPADLAHVRGIAFDAITGHLHVLDRRSGKLAEVSATGRIVATRDLSELALGNAEAMAIAPSSDATDDPSDMSVFIAASGTITEVSLSESAVTEVIATSAATFVRTTETSRYSPPSPDPSGIAYASHLDALLIVDCEVNEMPIYAGANVFETTLSGSLTRAWTTTSFSNEPVGAAYNPANRHLFISDDDKRMIFEVDPGVDGKYSTADDRITSFPTPAFGSNDPEGLAFDGAQGVLYIADGVNAQVYRVAPGPNGIFDGVAPTGDDVASNFDTQAHGLLDPEGIAFDSNLGRLYVVGKPSTRVFELSTTGALIGTIDISAAAADKPAGLEFVPASTSGGTPMLYIVDRGVDNNSDPNENDGKLYQFSLPASSGNNPPSVTVSAPANGAVYTEGTDITFTGTASDVEDGSLTASLAWRSSRDGALGSGGSVTTSGLSIGTHTITASVTDANGAQASATVTITVNSATSGNSVQVRISASADDAEESATGSMSLTSGALELVFAKTNQLVGMRFNNVTIPAGATITSASVQFQADKANTDPASLVIHGQAADNPVAFSTSARISSRPRTAGQVSWSPAPWTAAGQAGAGQLTPSLTPIVQEIVSRPGWRSGNSLVIIVTGTGKRVAESFNGLPAAAPLLRVEFSTGPNVAPTATNVTVSGTPQVGRTLTGNYTYADANADPEGASTYRWLRDGAPISGATARSYVLGQADEGGSIAFEVTPVAVAGANPGESVASTAVGPVTPAPVNTAPSATNAMISGGAQVGQAVTGNYTYADADGDVEGASIYRWLRGDVAISGATARSYTLVPADQGALIRFEVTPVAASGTSPGAAVQSQAIGPVAGAGTATLVQVRVAASADDAEESPSGSVSLTSTDLELVVDGTTNKLVGLRFNGVAIPRGATITGAYVQFQVDEVSSDATSLTINGQAADNALAFSSTAKISSRPRTASSSAWSPAAWTTTGQAGTSQQTSNIGAIIQEIVNRPGWQSGNSLALIITGAGRRVAEAFDGVPAAAALLRVEYSVGSPTP